MPESDEKIMRKIDELMKSPEKFEEYVSSRQGGQELAEALDGDRKGLCGLLENQKRLLFHRALVAWERSPETFGEETVALNDIDETLRNNCTDV